MQTYLITMYHPPGPPPADIDMSAVMAEIEQVNEDIRAAGGWVFAGGLTPPSSATTLRSGQGSGRDAEVGARSATPLVVDGPFLEVKEHLGGLTIVRAEDLDVVLGWARRLQAATGLPMEVRPFLPGPPEPDAAAPDTAADTAAPDAPATAG